MLPSKTEISLAKKANIDLYTITNVSFFDLAQQLNIQPNVFAITRHDLANREEPIVAFNNLELFTKGDISINNS